MYNPQPAITTPTVGPPQPGTTSLLDLADYIEDPSQCRRFRMDVWCVCIAGSALSMVGEDPWLLRDEATFERARELLGISVHQANTLFIPHSILSSVTRSMAARVLRHLDATGVVNWHA
jgi:hypothetical protein